MGQKLSTTKKLIMILIVALVIIGVGSVTLAKGSVKTEANTWNNSSNLLASKHHNVGVSCEQCHGQDQLGIGFKKLTGGKSDSVSSQESCLKCHTREKIKTATNFSHGNPHDNHNGEQDCLTCHQVHKQSTPSCLECHTFDWINELDDGWVKEVNKKAL